MPLLTQPAIALLEQLGESASSKWTSTEGLPAGALTELERERLVETQLWPPPGPERRAAWRMPPGGLAKTRVPRREVRITERGALRLERLRAARNMRPRRAS